MKGLEIHEEWLFQSQGGSGGISSVFTTERTLLRGGAGLSCPVCSERTRVNLKRTEKIQIRYWKKNFIRMIRHWNGLCIEMGGGTILRGIEEESGSGTGWWFSSLRLTVVVLGWLLDLIILKVSSKVDWFCDSMILCSPYLIFFSILRGFL